MKKTLKRIFITALTVILLVGTALPCLATEQNGKIKVTLEDKDKVRVDGIKVNICHVAELNNTGYYPAKAFENSGISIAGIVNNPDAATAKTLADYIKNNQIKPMSAISEYGNVTFDKLKLGIWLVYPEDSGKYTFNPYIVFLPFESGGKINYEVASLPKLEDNTPNDINVYVIKKWDDNNNASKKRPDSVTVELLDSDKVVSTVVLSEENGWSHTFAKLSKEGNYSVREKTVADYTANYSGDATNGFVVTNTYSGEKLPQTGQHWWPIVLIAIAGACFVLLGIFEIGAKKNGKKN